MDTRAKQVESSAASRLASARAVVTTMIGKLIFWDDDFNPRMPVLRSPASD